jgi:hypothetical protein
MDEVDGMGAGDRGGYVYTHYLYLQYVYTHYCYLRDPIIPCMHTVYDMSAHLAVVVQHMCCASGRVYTL